VSGLFVPGWGAHAGLYRAAMPAGWDVLDPPSFGATDGLLQAYRDWLRAECRDRPQPVHLGGHSFGAALAVFAAADGEVAVDRLVLVNPAGLPLTKPALLMLRDFLCRLGGGWFPLSEAARSVGETLARPRAAMRLGREVRALNLYDKFRQIERRHIRCTVVAASSDTLTPPALCRRVASLSGGEYRELDVDGGHLWFLRAPGLLKEQLAG
jgi:pimeloyl-ACP methyl ester carboxylesterase